MAAARTAFESPLGPSADCLSADQVVDAIHLGRGASAPMLAHLLGCGICVDNTKAANAALSLGTADASERTPVLIGFTEESVVVPVPAPGDLAIECLVFVARPTEIESADLGLRELRLQGGVESGRWEVVETLDLDGDGEADAYRVRFEDLKLKRRVRGPLERGQSVTDPIRLVGEIGDGEFGIGFHGQARLRLVPEATPATATAAVAVSAGSRTGVQRFFDIFAPSMILKAASAVIVAGGAVYAYQQITGSYPRTDPPPAGLSIAVLPFERLSTDGVSEGIEFGPPASMAGFFYPHLVDHVAMIEGVDVASAGAGWRIGESVPVSGWNRDVDWASGRDIAQRLNVATLLHGSVREVDDQIFISMSLADPKREVELWSRDYAEDVTTMNLASITRDAVVGVADVFGSPLSEEHRQWVAHDPLESLSAYNAYAEGEYWRARGDVESTERALAAYDRAIADDPSFAAAHAGRAMALLSLARSGNRDQEEAWDFASSAVAEALRLEDSRPQALTAEGQLRFAKGDLKEAEEAFRRAIQTRPTYAEAHGDLAMLLSSRGDPVAAQAEFERALKLDPLNLRWQTNLAVNSIFGRDYTRAEEASRYVIESEPESPLGYYVLGAAMTFQNRHSEAIAAATRAVELDPNDLLNEALLGLAFARKGDRTRAVEHADRVAAGGGSLYEVAAVHTALRDFDRAFMYLDSALVVDRGSLNLIEVDPSFDPLRGDPRYGSLISRIESF